MQAYIRDEELLVVLLRHPVGCAGRLEGQAVAITWKTWRECIDRSLTNRYVLLGIILQRSRHDQVLDVLEEQVGCAALLSHYATKNDKESSQQGRNTITDRHPFGKRVKSFICTGRPGRC